MKHFFINVLFIIFICYLCHDENVILKKIQITNFKYIIKI